MASSIAYHWQSAKGFTSVQKQSAIGYFVLCESCELAWKASASFPATEIVNVLF